MFKMNDEVMLVDGNQQVQRGKVNMAPTGPEKRIGVLLDSGRMMVVHPRRVRKVEDGQG